MKTEDLIAKLAEDARAPRRETHHGAFWQCAGCALLVAGLAVVLGFGVRPDAAHAGAAIALKSFFGLGAALSLLPLVARVLEPTTSVRSLALPVFVFAAASVLVAGTALATDHSWRGLLLNMGWPECLMRVPLLALPGAALLFWSARRYAPTRLALAGAVIGAFSASIAIIAYSWFCMADSVAYVGLWYLGAIAICAGIGALVGPRVLRW